MGSLHGYMSVVMSVGFSTDRSLIVSGPQDKTIRLSGEVMSPLIGHTGLLNSISFSPDGIHIALGSDDNTVQIWDMRTGKEIMMPLEGHISCIVSVSFSPDGTHIVSGSIDNMADVEPKKPLEGQTTLSSLLPPVVLLIKQRDETDSARSERDAEKKHNHY